NVARLHLVALLHQPLGERALLHRRGKRGHLEFDGHRLHPSEESSRGSKPMRRFGSSESRTAGPPACARGRFDAAMFAQMGEEAKRTYLVVVDDSAEARVALRFAARRAAKTGGRIEVLGIVEPQDFVQFGGVQAAIEEEQ